MGQSSSNISGETSGEGPRSCPKGEYQALSDQFELTCRPERWIVDAPGPESDNTNEQWTAAVTRVTKALPDWDKPLALTRWAFLAPYSDQRDAAQRLKFLDKWLSPKGGKGLHKFLQHEDAWELARLHKGQAVVFLDASLAGNVNIALITKGDQPYWRMVYIDKDVKLKQTLEAFVNAHLQVAQHSHLKVYKP